MLDNLCPKAQECHRHAMEARRRAANTTDEKLRADFLDMEARWLRLAESYQFAASMNARLADHAS